MTSAADAMSCVAALDDLYRQVVTSPDAWGEPEVAGWLEDFAAQRPEGLDRQAARQIRRAVRQALKLARYWSAADRARPADWRSAVDEALGSPGWAPGLDLARAALEMDPDPELFELVADRFRVVHFRPWMEGIDFDSWVRQRADSPPGR